MPFWVYGHCDRTGEPSEPFFSEAASGGESASCTNNDDCSWKNIAGVRYVLNTIFNIKYQDLVNEYVRSSPIVKHPYLYQGSFEYPSYFGEKPGNYQELCTVNQHYADLAASIQRVTEEVLLGMVQHLKQTTDSENLCIAGGVGLNSVANGRIVKESGFRNVYIQPAAGDGGGALGAALHAYHTVLGNPRKLVMRHAYLGQAYGDDEIRGFLDRGCLEARGSAVISVQGRRRRRAQAEHDERRICFER